MSIAAFVAGVDRILTRAHGLYPAGAAGGPLPTSGGAAVPASPQGAGGLQGAATRAAGAYQQARGGAAALDQELQRAAEQGGAIGAQGRLGSGVIRDQARAVAAAAGPLTKSPAGAHLIMAAMDQHLAAMQGQLQTTKTENQAVSATLRQTTTGYQALSNGAKDSPADPTIRAAGWRPGNQVPASPAPPGLPGVPPVATDPRNPFVGDPRFGYWDTYTPPPYTGPRPPPPTNQHVPWRDGPEGGPTGFYTPGRTWIGDNDAPFASYQQQYKLRIAGEDLTSYTRVGPTGQTERWVAYTYEAQEFQNVKLNGDIWVKTPSDASTAGVGGVATGGIGGIAVPPKIGPWQPITPAQIAVLSANNPNVHYYVPDPCGQQFSFVNGVPIGGNEAGPITPSIIAGPPG